MIRAAIYRNGAPEALTAEQEALKRELYEKTAPGRRKFIDRIGYDHWHPFQKPNDPMDMRVDISKRTTQQLVREFLRQATEREERFGADYRRGVLECALGVVNRDEKCLGMFDFCLWYHKLLKEEGYLDESAL